MYFSTSTFFQALLFLLVIYGCVRQLGRSSDEEDLVAVNPSDRNWKGIIIAVVVIVTVLALIVTSVVLLTPPEEGPRVKGKRFELDDIFSSKFQPLRVNGSWVADNEWIFWDTSGGVSIMAIEKDNISVRPLIANYTFRQLDAKLSGISSNLRYALLVHDVRPVHRHSTTAKYTLYNTDTRAIKPLSVESGSPDRPESDHMRMQLAKWSPTGSSLVLVHQGDIYYKPDLTNNLTHRLTKSALPGVVSNGVPDWLYEEEILESNSALWFSPDGQNLLYLTFNDSLVGQHTMLQYGSLEEPFIYPQVKKLRYPKPGTTNPTVTARVVELRQSRAFRTQELRPPEGISDPDYYITAGGWVKNTNVGIIWTSRSYNVSIISVCSTRNGTCQEMYRITMGEKRGWVDRIPFPIFTSNPNSMNFITIAPIRDGENGFFDHLVFVDSANKRSHPITHGSMDVIKINAWDEERKLIYFLAIPATAPKERRFYSLRVEQPYTEHTPNCVSCPTIVNTDPLPATRIAAKENKTTGAPPTMSPMPNKQSQTPKKSQKQGKLGSGGLGFGGEYGQGSGHPEGGAHQDGEEHKPKGPWVDTQGNVLFGANTSCSFVTTVKFSPNKSYVTLECGGPGIPFVTLANVNQSNLRLIQTLQNNDALRNLTSAMAFPNLKTFDVQLNAGHTVQVRLLLPPGLREDEITKYPLLLNVYGGPGTQLVLDRWGVDFATYLASKKDFIVAQVDSRGSGGRGWDFQHKVYYKVGVMEAEDQIAVVRYLRDSLHFVDERKIGVWGWSYGGYLTAMIMANKDSSNLFQCGASVAPVTNWKLYDSAYTERYMGMPNVTENYKGYAESDVTQNVDNFEKKMFYLLHGTADDNVHIQHSMLLAKALIAKKILFRQQIYPDEPHSLKGVQLHVHKSLEEFFDDCFRKQKDPDLGTGLNRGGQVDEFDE